MGKKEKKHDIAAISARAEKFFVKGNFELAKKDFEKLGESACDDQLIAKIKRCDEEISKIRLNDFIKRAKKSLKKEKYEDALINFEKAWNIGHEKWIEDKINLLRDKLGSCNTLKSALAAISSGNFVKAADLYLEAYQTEKKDDLLIERGICLVKAERYQVAIDTLKEFELTQDNHKYYYGFAFARTGNYHLCYKIWNTIGSKNGNFLEQRREIESRVTGSLYHAFDDKRHEEVYSQGTELLQSIPSEDLSNLVRNSKYLFIADKWAEEDYQNVLESLLPYPEQPGPALLGIYAKVYLKLAEESGRYLKEAISFGLTAFYNDELIKESFSRLADFSEFSDIPKVRDELLKRVEQLVTGCKEGDAKSVYNHWALENRAVEKLYSVKMSIDYKGLLYTPHLAELFGLSDQMMNTLRKSRSSFSSPIEFLEVGGYYSAGGKSLKFLEDEEYDEALKHLPEDNENEFATYCKQKVFFEYGMECIKKGKGKVKKYFSVASSFINSTPKYEKELADMAYEAEDIDELILFEDALSSIYSPSKKIKELLSVMMSRKAIHMYCTRVINAKTMENILTKALKLFDKNEQAISRLSNIKSDYDMDKMDAAFKKGNINKAATIAANTENDQAVEMFFESAKYNLDMLAKEINSEEEELELLQMIYSNCCKVDKFHPVTLEAKNRLSIKE